MPLAVFIASLATFMLSNIPASAQGRSVSIARRADEFSKQSDKIARDQMEGEIGRKPLTKEEVRAAARVHTEIKEDLELLQASYNDIVSSLKGGGQMPADTATATIQKIHKSASRLRSNVALPKLPEPVTISEEKDQRRAMKELCLRIYTFLTSPVIENPAVIEPNSALKASQTLAAIIILSDRLRHQAP
jgi:hypothetical protein